MSVRYLLCSVRDLVRGRQIDVRDQGLIYSFGLFDYLSDWLSTSTIKKLYGMLAPGGSLVISNFCRTFRTEHTVSFGQLEDGVARRGRHDEVSAMPECRRATFRSCWMRRPAATCIW